MQPPRSALVSLLDPSTPEDLDEQDLQLLWRHVLPTMEDLSTKQGYRLKILDPGCVGFREGPDIQSATLRLNGIRRSGSVEVHRRPAHWYDHGHHENPAFNRVILHLSMVDGSREIRRADDRRVQQVCLRSIWRAVEERIRVLHGRRRTDCARGSARRHPNLSPPTSVKQRQRRLTRAGRAWLSHRASRLRRMDPPRRVGRAMLESLGSSTNHAGFRRLAQRVDLNRLQYVQTRAGGLAMEAYGLGRGGWLRRPFRDGPINRTIYRRRARWEATYPGTPAVVDPASNWVQAGVRPHATPLRRWVFYLWAGRRVEGTWSDWFEQGLRAFRAEPRSRRWFQRRLDRIFRLPSPSYWRHHYSRKDPVRGTVPRACGEHWFDQVTVNVLLPLIYLRGLQRGPSELCRSVESVLTRYPPRLSNHRHRRLAEGWRLASLDCENVLQQQGAVFLYKRLRRDVPSTESLRR